MAVTKVDPAAQATSDLTQMINTPPTTAPPKPKAAPKAKAPAKAKPKPTPAQQSGQAQPAKAPAPAKSTADARTKTDANGDLTMDQPLSEIDFSRAMAYATYRVNRRAGPFVPADTYSLSTVHMGAQQREMEGVNPRMVQSTKVSTVEAELAAFNRLTKAELTDLQQRMARAGYYGEADSRGRFGYSAGIRDDVTRNAYGAWMIAAARETVANPGVTADDVLDEQVAYHDGLGDLTAASRKPGTPDTAHLMQIDLTDPFQIASWGDQFGQKILGRNLTGEEKLSLIHGVQAEQQAKGMRAAAATQGVYDVNRGTAQALRDKEQASGPTGVEGRDTVTTAVDTDVDAQARVEAQLRAEHPTEAGAHDIFTGLSALRQALRRGTTE